MQRSLLSSAPVVKNLIIINVIFWIASIVLFNTFGIQLEQYLGLHYFRSQQFMPHQLITYMFMHSYMHMALGHIFFNMFALFMFGVMLERVWGSKRFLQYYLITGIGAGLVQMLVYYIRISSLEKGIDPETIQNIYKNGWSILQEGKNYSNEVLAQLNLMVNTSTIGASGAVFGILLAFGMLFPNTQLMLLFPPIPIKAKYFVIGYGVIELFAGVANRSGDNVAHFAHLGGMLFGFFLIRYWNKNTKNFY
ncbi:rhomboid family intramembrane serine protease [Saccharicrinis sp. FJH2]|uniref:rhomboid family intramembrane serine protease n=1 Tax=unclassified Saccharicrinis TaxID=2646859 RepID=UPI0035D47374